MWRNMGVMVAPPPSIPLPYFSCLQPPRSSCPLSSHQSTNRVAMEEVDTPEAVGVRGASVKRRRTGAMSRESDGGDTEVLAWGQMPGQRLLVAASSRICPMKATGG